MSENTITLDALSSEQVNALVEQLRAREEATKAAAKDAANEKKANDAKFCATVGQAILARYEVAQFGSGARGIQVTGCEFEHEGVTYTINSLLVRVTSSIPPKATK